MFLASPLLASLRNRRQSLLPASQPDAGVPKGLKIGDFSRIAAIAMVDEVDVVRLAVGQDGVGDRQRVPRSADAGDRDPRFLAAPASWSAVGPPTVSAGSPMGVLSLADIHRNRRRRLVRGRGLLWLPARLSGVPSRPHRRPAGAIAWMRRTIRSKASIAPCRSCGSGRKQPQVGADLICLAFSS